MVKLWLVQLLTACFLCRVYITYFNTSCQKFRQLNIKEKILNLQKKQVQPKVKHVDNQQTGCQYHINLTCLTNDLYLNRCSVQNGDMGISGVEHFQLQSCKSMRYMLYYTDLDSGENINWSKIKCNVNVVSRPRLGWGILCTRLLLSLSSTGLVSG